MADQATRDRVQRAARRAAMRNGINPDIFARQIGAESNFDPNARSGAGAVGVAQFEPGTAAQMGVNLNDGRVTDDLNGAARLDAQYLHRYGGSWSKALQAYNAGPGNVGKPLYSETAAYIRRILGGGDVTDTPTGGGGGGGASATPASVKYGTTSITTQSPELARAQFFAQWFAKNNPESPLVKLGAIDPNMSTAVTTKVPLATGIVGGLPTSGAQPSGKVVSFGNGQVKVAPGANRSGAALANILTAYVRATAARSRRTLTIGTGTNHNRLTVDGNVSDHWDGHAADLPVPVDSRQGDMIAAHALTVAGVPWGRAVKMAQTGGLYTLNPSSGPFAGRRVQVIWKTYDGGNHHNHVHIGVR